MFARWTPAEGATFHHFLGRLDGTGGFALVEADDPNDVLDGPSKFGPFFECLPCRRHRRHHAGCAAGGRVQGLDQLSRLSAGWSNPGTGGGRGPTARRARGSARPGR
ncbi:MULTISPECIES: DUF3303 domain-containing protein [Rhodococcus]|uniref:DUF3303 domain-containing protein n=1 Tax=Rhodococcus sp. 21391 TaxID=2683591 RepID=UPI001ED8FFBA|nr:MULTISPECIES: DUF3303 domain-containing protein [Rhodococcus]